MGMKALYIEQTGVLMLIIGRWTLPKGSISRNQFSQILLIYIATAADILEFSETYTDRIVRSRAERATIYNEVMAIWGWSLMQFSFTIALPEDGLKQEDEEQKFTYDSNWRRTNRIAPLSYQHYKGMLTKGWDPNRNRNSRASGASQLRGSELESNKNVRDNSVDQTSVFKEVESVCISKMELKSCLVRNMELIRCLIPVLMQDGPFFGYRMVLIVRYNVITPMTILLTVKNALVIIVQIYRIVILYCSEAPIDEVDVNDPSVRVRAALKATNGRLSLRYSMQSTRDSMQVIREISEVKAASRHKADVPA